MSILNTSLFKSNVQIRSGVGYHNVGTGVLRASHQTTIDYVEAHYGQRCGHLPLGTQDVAVLVNEHTTEIQTQLMYLSKLFGKEIKAISSDEVLQDQMPFSMHPMLIVPYINVPETEQRIQTELRAESWGMKGNMVSFLKNKADFYQFIDECGIDGFRTPDYRIAQIADLSRGALDFLKNMEGVLKRANVPQYPLGVMLRAAESDGNYGCCLVYEQKNLVRVVPHGEVNLSTYYSSWEEAFIVAQQLLGDTMNQLKESRVVISRYLELADSPGMSVVIMNGRVESLGWNGQLQENGSKACIGTSTYKPPNATLARLQQEYEGQTLVFFEALLRLAAKKCGVDFATIRGVANIDIMIPAEIEETLQKNRGQTPTHYVAECNPRWTNYTDAIMTIIAANRFAQTVSNMMRVIQEGIVTIDKYHVPEAIDPHMVREFIFQRDEILKQSGTRIICRMAKSPMGLIFAGNIKMAQEEVANIIRHVTSKQINRI